MTLRRNIETLDTMPETLPLFPLAGALMLPRGQMPLNVFEPRYLDMVDAALRGNRLIGMIQPMDREAEDDTVPALFPVGCAGRITQFVEAEENRYIITLTGLCRFRLVTSSQRHLASSE